MQTPYPSQVAPTHYGRCLVATTNLKAGIAVARFEGPLVNSFAAVPESEVCYAILIAENEWLIPESNARFLNHSCNPNCIVDDNLEAVTIRPVERGEELTISYNTARPGEVLPAWDERWTFDCQCGAADCQGQVNGWLYE